VLGILLFTIMSKPALWPTQLPIQWVPGALSLGVKRSEREANHSPPSGGEVNNARAIPPLCLHGVVLKTRGQLYLYFIKH
jgi:hypothetical protein